MADILLTGGWIEPGSVGGYLGETLPDQYVVVVDPVVENQPIDVIVVGPHGLTIIEVTNGSPETSPMPDGTLQPKQTRLRGSRTTAASRPAPEIEAVQLFLRDEFPGVQSPIRRLQAQREPNGPLPVWRTMEAPGVSGETLEATILADETAGSPDRSLADDGVRQAVAEALRDRQLTTNQRAAHPFVFRSSTVLGGGARAWTINEVVAAMDRNPADGIYHLRNGSLAAWFAQEGAPHLAAQARAAVRQTSADHRAELEAFLLETGLVARPLLQPEPREVDLGYIVAGEQGSARLSLSKGKGHGYLFGKLDTSDPWLTVEPRVFRGGRLDTVVTVDTSTLVIHGEPYLAEIYVDSSASPAPLTVPVHFRVVPAATAMHRKAVRPLAGFLVAGGLGALVGTLWALSGIAGPLGIQPTGLVWVVAVALLWGSLGAVRGAWQPSAWPLGYALKRCLLRLAAWAAVLMVIALGITGAISLFSTGAVLNDQSWWAAALCGLTAAIFPATLAEAERGRQVRLIGQTGAQPAQQGKRWLAVAVVIILLLVGGLLAGQRADVGAALGDWQARGTTWLAAVEETAADVLDQIYLRYLDRRAPPAPTVVPTVVP